ncbi:MAG: LEA type 2 family protein [Treponema sp.]|jgi:LEA14-like dessication related protein|nr:LEA type 2 family protein [Treponema sp.]
MKTGVFFKIVAAGALLFMTLSLSTCQTLMGAFQEPVISLHSTELASITINGVQLLCKVKIENPNAFNIPFPETDWELFLNANSFIKGTVRNNERLRARGTTLVEVPVSFNYTDVFNTFASLIGSNQTGYKVALGVKFAIPVLGDKVWRFEHEGSIPFPQLPRITSPSMSIGNRNTSGVEILITVNFENPNPFDFPSPKITYNYMLNRNSFIRGIVENEGPLAASATTPVVFRLMVNYADLLRNFASLMTASQVSSQLTLSCDFGIPFLNRQLNVDLSGTLPLR